jgi:23S rRNA (cytidine2498-2'-O)-methyltransferase
LLGGYYGWGPRASFEKRAERLDWAGSDDHNAGALSWAFLCRSGWERDLVAELGEQAEAIAEGVVLANERPKDSEGHLVEPAFARQAMRTEADRSEYDVELLADRIADQMKRRMPAKEEPWRWCLQVVAPDSKDPRDPRRRWVEASAEELAGALRVRLAPRVRDRETAEEEAERLVQVWPVDETGVLVGVTHVGEALSIAPTVRLRRAEDSPSRSGLKLEEAIRWLGTGPEKGDRVADLGAAPGGWSQVAVARGANVVAVDPARIKIDLPPKKFVHLRQSAFEYAPEETLDWVLCDMAWRPLEVGKLLAKWGRRGWARSMIANIKLPMKKRTEMLRQVLGMLGEAGWRGLRARQLVYDRDEVTIFAWLDPGIVIRGAKAPFVMRSQRNKPRKDVRPRKKTKRKTSIKRR